MKRAGRTLIVRTEAKGRAVMRPSLRLTLRQNCGALSRFEAAETYRRASALTRRRTALCIDRLA